MNQSNKTLNNKITKLVNQPYKYGFSTTIEKDIIEKGLNEKVIRLLSKKKNEPKFLLNFRLKAYKKWKEMKCPEWAQLKFSEIDYQDIVYYSAPKIKKKLNSFIRKFRNCILKVVTMYLQLINSKSLNSKL